MRSELIELADSVRSVTNALGIAAPEAEIWPQVVALGWLQANVPEDLGGLGLGVPSVCAIQQELGCRLAAAPYASLKLAIDAICQSNLKDRNAWVERLVGGELVSAPLVEAALKVQGGRITGRLAAVASADQASHVLVCADELVALVPTQSLELRARPTWDETRRLFDCALPAQGIAPETVLATGTAAKALQQRLASQLDFTLAADSAGGAAALLEMTVEYLQTRKQFGRPLALFQALKHRCADLKASVTAAEALLSDSLDRADLSQDAALAMGAKQFACSVYTRVAEEAIQLHGGIGMTAEHPCHLFLKRAQLNEQLGWHRERYELGIAEAFLNSQSKDHRE